MNNLIKFLIYLLVILLLVSWLITVGKSCGKSNESANETPVSTEMNIDSATDLMEDLEEEVDFTEELESILDEEETAFEEIEEVPEKQKTEEVVRETPAPKKEAPKKPVTEPKITQSASSFPGNYLVVAGSFIHPDYANGHSQKIAGLGYDAEVVVFELSEYHTVLAGRFETQSDAQKIVDRLRGDGIDAYVKKRTR